MMTSYNILQPIGTIITGSMTLGDYVEKMFFLLIGVAGVLAVVMLVICGMKLMMSEGAGGREAAKKCIWDAIFGLLIAIGAWLLLNTINPQLVSSSLTMDVVTINTTVAAPAATTEAAPTVRGCHFKYRKPDGSIHYSKNATCSACENIRENFLAAREGSADPSNEIEVLSTCYEIKEAAVSSPPTPPSTTASSQTGAQCRFSGKNLCDPQARQCTFHPNCTNSTYVNWAQSGASAAGSSLVTKQLLMAIFVQESSCGTNVKQSTAGACGPTQILPGTARAISSMCGLNFSDKSNAQICSWMNDKANWEKDFCMTAFYIRQSAQNGGCENKIQNIIASYNSGPGNGCQNSASCSGDTSCTGGTIKRWECLYDNNAHSLCNTGLDETRRYVGNVLYCMGNLGI